MNVPSVFVSNSAKISSNSFQVTTTFHVKNKGISSGINGVCFCTVFLTYKNTIHLHL